MHTTKYTKRLVARLVLECKSPLAIGSGETTILTDSAIAKDINGLPYIPGTSLAGVLRHAVKGHPAYDLFGKYGDSNGEGSKLIFSDAKIIDGDGKVIDNIISPESRSKFLKYYNYLPVRHHAKIDGSGATVKSGKFDNEVVYAGTRFCFEIELIAQDSEIESANEILSQLSSESFRIGGSTRKGYGAISVVNCYKRVFDLCDKNDLEDYLKKSSSLSEEWKGDNCTLEAKTEDFVKYELSLSAEDFHIFASGHGDSDADAVPVTEGMIVWENEDKGVFKENCFLIPSSSIKGALAHRVAFHMNRLCERYSDKPDTHARPSEYNEAVLTLFGSDNIETDPSKTNIALRGATLISDIIQQQEGTTKLFNHVSIDSFTNAGINGALYNEKACYKSPEDIKLTIIVNKKDFDTNINKLFTSIPYFDEDKTRQNIWAALENSIDDICNSRLPLGGLVDKGHGRFTGTWKKENNEN